MRDKTKTKSHAINLKHKTLFNFIRHAGIA